MRFRLITYNMHKGIGGTDRQYRPERIVELLQNYAADVVLLQEVDEGVRRSRHDRQVDLLGDQLNMPHRAFQRNVHLKEGHYGNAILSRHPLEEIASIDLSIPLKKTRRALIAYCHLQLAGHTRSIRIANVHLGLSGLERKMQLRKLLNQSQLTQMHSNSPVIIGGDFNDVWGSLRTKIMQPAGFSSAGKAIRTFPAILPMRPLDRIFYRGKLTVTHVFAARSQLARKASDHLPLVADFHIE